MAGTPSIPLLGASSKPKKDEKTYIFELTIGESNEETYPEFSWKDLVAADQTKTRLASSGKTILDPYASDDEEHLKAMAAKFEKKYKTSHSSKRKRRAEDYIDRGAGYDETDSFIDNSDVYDEVVPADLETVRGGFYINSGSLDFKEVEVSEEEEDEPANEDNIAMENGKATNGSHRNKTGGEKRPSSVLVPKKVSSLSSKTKSEHGILKSKGSSSSNKSIVTPVAKIPCQIEDVPKKGSSENESSSSSSSSGSSSDASTSSSSDSSSSEDDDDMTDFKEPKKQVSKDVKKLIQPQRTSTPTTVTATTVPIMTPNSTESPPVKRLKTKNVPPNPNLPKNKIINNKASPAGLANVSSSKDMIVTSTSSPSPKLMPRPIQTVTPISSVTNLGGLNIPHGMTASNIKVPTPKTTPTGSHSTTQQNSSTSLLGLNLVKQQHSPSSTVIPKQKSLKSKHNLSSSSLLTDPTIMQTTLNLVNSFAATQSNVVPTAKKKPKLTKVTTNSTRSTLSSKQQRPPKLKARPTLKHMVPINLPSPTMQNTSNLSQTIPSFSRPSQQPSSQRVEITKIKPAHSNSIPSAHHQLSSSIKSLSSLGTGIFPVSVSDVKEKVGPSSSSSSSSTFVAGTTSSPRSRSPNVVSVSGVASHSNNNANSMGSSRLPQSLTITPSPLSNISSTSGPSSSSAGNSNIHLSNIMSAIPISRGNSLLFGQQQLATSSSGFSMNNILGKEFTTATPTATPINPKDFFVDQNLIASMAYNMSREAHKK